MSAPAGAFESDTAVAVRAALAALVVKDGVIRGGLAALPHAMALGLAWSALPSDPALREANVNTAFKRARRRAWEARQTGAAKEPA